ncbi:hypothetical protein [Parasphingorhabdus halotolerans]|uniref:Uncharacterized protein n=1 Tax=Parasphingorhabdus halotolerans TaxID=2725558 RepID=A0A6H2DMT5_9SPHN|nr:hypothetical protein [Parasphingorhabdus halotolerans]QJB69979.1 hypothetical protein HF685_12340 [Parasphingorhabdus halotolerans]
MSPQMAGKYMRIVGIFSILVAVLFALAGVNDFTGVNDLFFRLASSGNEGVAGLNTLEAKMAMAIAGGVFGGLMAMYVFISAPGVEQGNELIRKGSIYTFLTWFIIDSGASLASGNAPNVIPNVIFLVTYLAPLLLVKRETARHT